MVTVGQVEVTTIPRLACIIPPSLIGTQYETQIPQEGRKQGESQRCFGVDMVQDRGGLTASSVF